MSGVEILGLAASVIQIAELGAKLSVKLFTFTRKVKNANKTIDALSQEIAVTGAVLQQLGETLSNDKSVKVCSQEAIDTAKKLVSDTEKVFRNLENLLDVQEKPSSKFRKAVNLKRLKFPFLESEIEQVQANLERLKSSLLVILNVLIFAEQLRNRETLPILQDQRELIRILAAEKDENEQRYERILKAIADHPKPQGDGQSDTSSLHSNTLTLVDPSDNIPPVGPTKQPGDKPVDEPPVIDLPDGLKLYYERICHHTHLVQNLLSEIDSLEYKLDHSTRGRMHTGVLDVHWNEWNPQRRLFGIHSFEKILHNSAEVATYWADKAINEQLQAPQQPVALGSSTPNLLKSDESQSLQTEIDATKKLMKENIERIMERGESYDQLATKTDGLALSAQGFRRQTQKSSWYSVLSTPVVWVGSALGAVGSIPARLWQGQSELDPDPPVPNPIRFTHDVEEDLNARKNLLAAATGTKIGLLPESEAQEYTSLREQMQQPELTIDECTKQQVRLFEVVFEDFDNIASEGFPVEWLGDMIRCFGYNPADRSLDTWCLEVGLKAGDTVVFEKYIGFMLRATDELRESGIDDQAVDAPTSRQELRLADNGTVDQIPGSQQKSKFSVDDLSEEQRQEFKREFELFDKDKTGTVKATNLIDILRHLGQNPTETEIQNLSSQANLTKEDNMTFDDLLEIIASILEERGEEPSTHVPYKTEPHLIPITEVFAATKSIGGISTEAELQDLLDKLGLAGKTALTEDELAKFTTEVNERLKVSDSPPKTPVADENLTEMVFEEDSVPEPIDFDKFSRLINDNNPGDDPGTSDPKRPPPEVNPPPDSSSPPSLGKAKVLQSQVVDKPTGLEWDDLESARNRRLAMDHALSPASLELPITPSPTPSENKPSEPEPQPPKSVINQHRTHQIISHSRPGPRSKRRVGPLTPPRAREGVGPPIPVPIEKRLSPSFRRETGNGLPDFYGDVNDGPNLDLNMGVNMGTDMDLDLAFRHEHRINSASRSRKGFARKKQAPSLFDSEEPEVPEPKKLVGEVDEVDALILRYTNVGGEELRRWTLIGE